MGNYSEFKQGNNRIRIPGKVSPEEYEQYAKILRANNLDRDKCKFKAGPFSGEIGPDFPILKYTLAVAIPIGFYFGCKYLYNRSKQKALPSPSNGHGKLLNENKDVTYADYEEVRDDAEVQKEESLSWLEKFMNDNPMPELPDFLEKIISGTPKQNAPAMVFHVLCMLAAICFSKVRAKYLDGMIHAPNLQIIIEAPSGSGKGQFEHVYHELFSEVIERDLKVLLAKEKSSNGSPRISQTAGVGFSMSSFVDMFADNQGCHFYIFNSETIALYEDLKKTNGLNVDFLRKAFENGEIARNSKASGVKNGIFKIFCNLTVTGTPNDVERTFGKQVEGGTNNRIAWCVIPAMGMNPESLKMPEGDMLKRMQEQIRNWSTRYCFKEKDSMDEAAEEHPVNLDYVCQALENWNKSQYETGDLVRQSARLRMATIAFHCAMVLHMLWGEPEDSETRGKVVNLTLYLADHCMERYLLKFGEKEREIAQKNKEREKVNNETPTPRQQPIADNVMSKEDEEKACVERMKVLYDEGRSQGDIALAIYGSKEGRYKKKVKRGLDKAYPGQIAWGTNEV